jgi:hypothetical protein
VEYLPRLTCGNVRCLGLLDAVVNAEQTRQTTPPMGDDGVARRDHHRPGRTRLARRHPVAGWGPDVRVEQDPTSPRLSPVVGTTGLGRVSHVSEETDLMGSGDDGYDDPNDDRPDDQAADIDAAMAAARARLAEVPAEVMVTNHAMGLYELAAIHLSADMPDLVAASLAIDAMGLLVDGLGDRLGDDAPAMRDALGNIKMAFVGVKARIGQSDPSDH